MKRILIALFLLFILLEGTLLAVPAKRVVQTIRQPDGTMLDIVLQGDENFHFVTTTDDIMLQKAPDGFMKYAVAISGGIISAGGCIAHNPGERAEKEIAYIKEINTARINQSIQQMRMTGIGPRLQADTKKTKFPNRGTVHGLIILAQYKDVKFAENSTPEEFNRMMNSKGFSNNGAMGSARDYFIDQSSGMFTPEFDIVGPVTLPENMGYYGGNSTFGKDQNPARMAIDACYAADSLLNVDFSQYDYDNDGCVDLVYIIYAGYAEAKGGPANSIWPHAWNLEMAGYKDIKADGKQIKSYACSSELNGNSGAIMDGIGTFCHEFSHCLGLPDIYDTKYTGMIGMGPWSLMDYGCYNNESRTPAGYSAYERYSVGWLNPTILEKPQKGIELRAMDTSNQAYLLISDQNPNEYYTIENRQPSGWDTYLPGHGMMIVHVDYVPALWESNIINSSAAKYPHLQIVPADNEFTDFTGDAFTGVGGYSSFTNESLPAAMLYSGGFLNKPLSGIKEVDGVITFDFRHFVSTPVATEATGIMGESFTANWEPVNDATSYLLEVTACMTGRKNLSEEFGNFLKGSPTEVDEQDVTSDLNSYTEMSGWTGHGIYQAGGHIRIGSKDSEGYLMTPLLDLTKEKEFTLCCSMKGSKSLINGYIFQLLDVNGKVLLNKSILMDASKKTIYWVFSTDAEAGSIRIDAKAAAIFDYIHVYDGDVREQLEEGKSLTVPEKYEIKVEDICNNSYTLAGLDIDKKYIYNVYARMNGEISQKSNKTVVRTLNFSDVENLSVIRKVYAIKETLYINAGIQCPVCIYTADGVIVYSGICREGMNEIPLSAGFYILTIDAEQFKIYVPL